MNLGVATLVGLAVGIERQWSGHASEQFAGVRTFFVLGLLAGLAGWFLGTGSEAVGVILLAAGAGLTLAAYVLTARVGGEGIHGTTEAAGLLVLGLAAAAGLGYVKLAAGATALTVLVLHEKTRIHQLVERVGQREMLAAFQFAVLALVVLPLLPEGPYGPFGGVRPRGLWAVVLLFTAINFAGYLARRAVGDAAGYSLAGLLGGLVSSTAVSLTFSPRSRKEPDLARPLGVGVIAASTVLVPRLVVITLLLNVEVALRLVPYVAPMFLMGVALIARPVIRGLGQRARADLSSVRSPLRLWSAIKMTVAFAVVLMIVHEVERLFGSSGVLWSAAIVGLTDTDALTLAMARLGQRPDLLAVAAKAIAIGVLANTMFKLGVTMTLGTPAFRKVASLGLVLLALGAAGALVVGW
ncbi:MAG: MgtC/SapB family protein [Gemmatimonadota bacterium]|nr:MgtC/SapB family protein [Gemmatimonadota bacterium]